MSSTNGSQTSVLSNLASIIIPCCGMVEYTRQLVPSLLEYTREPFELIFIDIGSLDGTADYLAGLAVNVVRVLPRQGAQAFSFACRHPTQTGRDGLSLFN